LKEECEKELNLKIQKLKEELNKNLEKSKEELENFKSELKERKKKQENELTTSDIFTQIKESANEKNENEEEIEDDENFSLFRNNDNLNNENNKNNNKKMQIIEEENEKANDKIIHNIDNNLSYSHKEYQEFNSSKSNFGYSQNNLSSSQISNNSSQKNLGSSQNNIDSSQLSAIEIKGYSYECTNIINLVAYQYEGAETAKIDEVTLKNNGSNDWPNNVYLEFQPKSKVIGDKVKLKPQKSGEVEKYEVKFKNLKNFKEGEYDSYVKFFINDQNYGDELKLKVKILKKEDEDEEMNYYKDLIAEFRNSFSLNETEFSNERLFKALKENEYDLEQAFTSLYD
jgi:hypothetical protein